MTSYRWWWWWWWWWWYSILYQCSPTLLCPRLYSCDTKH